MELGAKYIYEVYRQKGFSAAARVLGIAQPSLSATVSKQEKALGFKIFNRAANPIALTVEGKYYIQHLEEIIESEKNMLYRIAHNYPSATNILRVAAITYSGHQVTVKAAGLFSAKHPRAPLSLNLIPNSPIDDLCKKLKRRTIDFAITSVPFANSGLTEILLAEDIFVFAARRDLAEAHGLLPYALTRGQVLSGCYGKDKAVSDNRIFSPLPFIPAGPESTTATKLSSLIGDDFKLSGIIMPNHHQAHYLLMREGIGAAITSKIQLLNPIFESEDLCFFIPKCEEPYLKLYLARNKEKPMHKHEEEFVNDIRAVLDFSKYAD